MLDLLSPKEFYYPCQASSSRIKSEKINFRIESKQPYFYYFSAQSSEEAEVNERGKNKDVATENHQEPKEKQPVDRDGRMLLQKFGDNRSFSHPCAL